MSCGTRAQESRPGDPDGAWLLRSSLWDQSLTKTSTAYCTVACGSAALQQPAPSPVLPWLGTLLPNFPMRASAADAFTEVLLTDFAAARQFIPARPYCLSGLREKIYPCNRRMSTPIIIDFLAFKATVSGRISWEASSTVKVQPWAGRRRARPRQLPGTPVGTCRRPRSAQAPPFVL
jgi:hypothetical protein